jgi:hypothetical protein
MSCLALLLTLTMERSADQSLNLDKKQVESRGWNGQSLVNLVYSEKPLILTIYVTPAKTFEI